MMQYFDSRGQMIRIGKQLGTGGEGAVFEIPGDSHIVAKIYHHAVSKEKAEKLRLMTSVASDDLTKFAALPVATLSNVQNGPVVGLLMPRVSGHSEIHNLYSPAYRKQKFPDKDWNFLVHVAMNCAAAFDALHGKSLVIGDVNQGNILVSERGTVFLIDCDSFQVAAPGKIFPCEVGVPHFTPPELQGKSFKGIQRTPNHDLFGLGVLVFHLLCMGRHPFAGRFLGSGDLPIEKAIAEFRYAYSRNAAALQIAAPPQTLALQSVMPKVANLFDRTFSRGSEQSNARPRANEWFSALRDFGASLGPCVGVMGHRYPKSLSACPWCELQTKGAPNFFVSVMAQAVTTSAAKFILDVKVLWTQIEAIPSPICSIASLIPTGSQLNVVAKPLPPEVLQSIGFSRPVGRIAVGALLASFATFILSGILAGFCFVSFVVFAVWWLVLNSTSRIASERHNRRQSLKSRRKTQQDLISDAESRLYKLSKRFENMRLSLGKARQQIEQLKPQYDAELQRLRDERERRQREQFLQSVLIADHKIEKIGNARVATLALYGIETAYDVDSSRILGIGGFGPGITSKLLEWRHKIESKFKFDASQAISPADNQALVTKYVHLSQQLESTLKSGILQLKNIHSDEESVLFEFSQKITEVARQVAQAEVDMSII